ncbi:MAG: MBL fold metallo-hydrolase [Candidatus Binatia bacterium]
MNLHILGCGDAFGSGGRNNSAYLFDAGDRLFLLDCGPTTLLALKRAGIDPQRLDAIFLSHLHGDHYGGLPFFVLEYLYETPRERPLHVAGPPGTENRVRDLFQFMFSDGAAPRDLPALQFHVLEPDQAAVIAGIHIEPFRVPHQVVDISLGLKLAYGGKTILYSGDSAWTEVFVEKARGADLFLLECCFFDRQSQNHMSYRTLEQNLHRLECKSLILTHLGPEMLDRKSSLTVQTADDGMVVAI